MTKEKEVNLYKRRRVFDIFNSISHKTQIF